MLATLHWGFVAMEEPTSGRDGGCQGSPALPQHLPPELFYGSLRSLAAAHMARERAGHTLRPTEVAHEAYLRLAGQTRACWRDEGHFRAVAAEVIRRILVDHARAKATQKRGGDRERVAAVDVPGPEGLPALDLLDLDDALSALERLSGRQSQVVELKFFGGLENAQIAAALGSSETLVKREWRFARAWLSSRLHPGLAG